jgi:hypothetical protein
MAQKVSIDGMADAIISALKEYSKISEEEMTQIARDVAKEGVKKLKATSPRGKSKDSYAKGWTVKYTRVGSNKFNFTVYNKTKPGLTHLLEKGHQIVQGKGGRAKAYPHIAKVEQWCNSEFEKRIKRRLSE